MADTRRDRTPRRAKSGGQYLVQPAPSGHGTCVYFTESNGQLVLIRTYGTMREALAFVEPFRAGRSGTYGRRR